MDLSDQLLTSIGITSYGHRHHILKVVRETLAAQAKASRAPSAMAAPQQQMAPYGVIPTKQKTALASPPAPPPFQTATVMAPIEVACHAAIVDIPPAASQPFSTASRPLGGRDFPRGEGIRKLKGCAVAPGGLLSRFPALQDPTPCGCVIGARASRWRCPDS